MSNFLGGMGGFGMPAPETPEDRQRRLLAAMVDPLASVNRNPDPGMISPGEVEPPPAPAEPMLREATSVMPEMLPTRPEVGTGANVGTPAAYTHLAPGLRNSGLGAVKPVYGSKDESGMTKEGYDQAPTPRLQDILTPQEEADRYMAHNPEEKRGKWGALGDVLKGILYGLQTGQGAIAGGLYGGTGQGRADARKLKREEMIGEITRNRGMQQQMRMQELEQLAAQGDIAASQELANLRRTQAYVAGQEKPAKYGFGGFDQPMITATDPTTGAIRQYRNEGYMAKPKGPDKVEWVDQPDGSKIAFKWDENGNPKPVQLEDGTVWRKAAGEKDETTTDRRYADEQAGLAFAGSEQGQIRERQIRELAEYEALQGIDHRFAVSGADIDGVLNQLAAEASQVPTVLKDDDPDAWGRQESARREAQAKWTAAMKAREAAKKVAADRWEIERKGAGGGGGGTGGGSFSGVSGYGGGR